MDKPAGITFERASHALQNEADHIERDQAIHARGILDPVKPPKKFIGNLYGQIPSAIT